MSSTSPKTSAVWADLTVARVLLVQLWSSLIHACPLPGKICLQQEVGNTKGDFYWFTYLNVCQSATRGFQRLRAAWGITRWPVPQGIFTAGERMDWQVPEQKAWSYEPTGYTIFLQIQFQYWVQLRYANIQGNSVARGPKHYTLRDSSCQRRHFGKSIPEFGEMHSSVLGCERRPVSASIMSRSCFASFPVCVYKFSSHYLNNIIFYRQ